MLKIVSKKINRADKKVLFELNNLLKQWSPKRKPINAGRFRELIKKSCLIGLFDGKRLIGTVTLIEMNKVSGRKGSIEHLIIDEKYRGRGLGEKLMRFALIVARKMKIKDISLTCEPERVAANALYKKLGFKIQKSKFYRLLPK